MNFRHRQERDETIVQTIHERDNKNGTTIVLVVPFLCPVIVYAEFSLRSCFRCNTQILKIANFKRDYLGNDNDSGHAVKTKNAPFFMNFLNI
jgi:hypothetical protein